MLTLGRLSVSVEAGGGRDSGGGVWVMWENCRDFPVCACSHVSGVGVYGNPTALRICPSGNVGNPRFVKIAPETADERTPPKPQIPDKLPQKPRDITTRSPMRGNLPHQPGATAVLQHPSMCCTAKYD
ncbi:hypothetical protein BTHE_1933 [Bifidobacterium thermophilum]|nr:hypothetical protein BTHE_1933 [Bifidobacterium thermophilum]